MPNLRLVNQVPFKKIYLMVSLAASKLKRHNLTTTIKPRTQKTTRKRTPRRALAAPRKRRSSEL